MIRPAEVPVAILLAVLVTPFAASSQGLAGAWLFRAETKDGLVEARMVLEQRQQVLSVTMYIDGHTLRGEGQHEKDQFQVTVRDADPRSPRDWVRLAGALSGGKLAGTWTDNSSSSGRWTAARAVGQDP